MTINSYIYCRSCKNQTPTNTPFITKKTFIQKGGQRLGLFLKGSCNVCNNNKSKRLNDADTLCLPESVRNMKDGEVASTETIISLFTYSEAVNDNWWTDISLTR